MSVTLHQTFEKPSLHLVVFNSGDKLVPKVSEHADRIDVDLRQGDTTVSFVFVGFEPHVPLADLIAFVAPINEYLQRKRDEAIAEADAALAAIRGIPEPEPTPEHELGNALIPLLDEMLAKKPGESAAA